MRPLEGDELVGNVMIISKPVQIAVPFADRDWSLKYHHLGPNNSISNKLSYGYFHSYLLHDLGAIDEMVLKYLLLNDMVKLRPSL